MAVKGFFITATGTDAGKTLVSCALLHQWRGQGHRVRAFKPLLSGHQPSDPASDTAMLLRASGGEAVEAITCQSFAAPLAPPQAAAAQGAAIDQAALRAFCQPPAQCDRYLVEGAGGVLSPFTDQLTNADFAAELGLPVILVAGSYLGAISHSLTARESLERRGLKLSLLVVNEGAAPGLPAEKTVEGLQPFLNGLPVAIVKALAKQEEMWKSVSDLTSWTG